MKKTLIKTIIFFSPFVSLGQEIVKPTEIKRNSVYIEAFGQGLYNSFSFDRLFNADNKIKTSFSAGLTIIPHPELFVLATPISYNYIFGQSNHHLELGIGLTAMYLRQGRVNASEAVYDEKGTLQTNTFQGSYTNVYSYFTPKIGYRFQKQSGGLFLRLTFTPLVAGINYIGGIKGGHLINESAEIEYFTHAGLFPYKIFPWGGLSIGWTLKK